MSSLRELDMDLKHSLRDRVSAGIDLSLLTSALLPLGERCRERRDLGI